MNIIKIFRNSETKSSTYKLFPKILVFKCQKQIHFWISKLLLQSISRKQISYTASTMYN